MWQLSRSHWFVLDLTGRYSLVLVQVKGTGHHGLCGLLGGLVTAQWSWVGVLGSAGLTLELRRSPDRRETTSSASTTPSAPAGPPWGQALSLLSCHCGRHSQRVRVVLPHVFHQVSLGGIRSVAEATGEQLGVLHCVRGQVHLEAGSVCVTTITVVALVRFVFVVLPSVRLEV